MKSLNKIKISKTRGILKGTWGKTKQEIDDNLNKERDSWYREFKL
jgi:hypothetical protein